MRSIDEVIKGAEACREGDCRNCPYFSGGNVCSDMLGLDMLEIIVRMKREHPEALALMAMSETEAA